MVAKVHRETQCLICRSYPNRDLQHLQHLHLHQIDTFLDRRCSLIDSPNHDHVYELLNYVKFLTQWRNQARKGGKPNHYFAPSTHQDSCWTALSFVIIARKDLPEGHAIVQSRGGTDNIEKTFCKSRGDNRAATAQGTDGSTANNQVSFLMKIVKAKGNTGHVKEIETREIDDTMVKKRRII